MNSPDPQEQFEVAMTHDPVYASVLKEIKSRPPELVRLSVRDAAAYLGVAVRTVRRWQAAGRMPPRFKVGRERRYRLLDIQELMKTPRIEGSTKPLPCSPLSPR